MGSSPIIGTIYRSGRIISSDRDRKMLVRVQLHDSVVYSLIGKTLKNYLYYSRYNIRAINSIGQSIRLITGRFRVRVPDGPPCSLRANTSQYGPLTQLAEYPAHNRAVQGSSPRWSTIALQQNKWRIGGMADTPVLGTGIERCKGSSPLFSTIFHFLMKM